MRTTVSLEPDVAALLRKRMRERDLSFKQALNEAVRAALGRQRASEPPFRQVTFGMGGVRPGVALDKALARAAALEDEEIALA